MNIQDIKLIFDYNYWANHQILAASEKVSAEQFAAPAAFPYGGLRGTLLHIVDAEYGWRVFFETDSFVDDLNPDDFPTLKSLEAQFRSEENAMRAYLASINDRDLADHRTYTTTDGELRHRQLWFCLMHVANHGTQHRSEAAAILTGFGASPGDLDFVVFLTEMGIT